MGKEIKLLPCGHYSTYRFTKAGYRICNKCHAQALYFERHPGRKPQPSFELLYSAWLNNRIAEAEKIELPRYYISGLKDARKMFMMHNPLLELVV